MKIYQNVPAISPELYYRGLVPKKSEIIKFLLERILKSVSWSKHQLRLRKLSDEYVTWRDRTLVDLVFGFSAYVSTL
jgi:hypothetical protein